MIEEFNRIQKILDQSASIVLTTHVNPDGDGLGCELALAAYLRATSKRVSILNHSATPSNYLFLDPANDLQQYDPLQHESLVSAADAIFVLDTNHPDRLVSMKDAVLKSRAKKICIDHHPDSGPFADVYVIDENATATGEIIYKMIAYLGGAVLDKSMCAGLYAAIMTDTGGFRYPKTDPEVHRIVARLIEGGADPVAIYDNVYEQGSPNRLQLLGRVLAGLTLNHDGTLAYLVVTKKMLEETSTSSEDTDAFVPYTLGVKGVKVGLMFTEQEEGVKINFRSKGDIRVNELAKQFGGNGHKNAAGARVSRIALPEIISQVVERANFLLSKDALT